MVNMNLFAGNMQNWEANDPFRVRPPLPFVFEIQTPKIPPFSVFRSVVSAMKSLL
jgi:hypothetical protein